MCWSTTPATASPGPSKRLPRKNIYPSSRPTSSASSEALAAELAPLGIHVCIVEPGPFRTDFLGRSGVEAAQRITDYDATAGKTREYFHQQAGKQPGDPDRAVAAILALAASENPPKHLVLGKLAFERMQNRLVQWHKDLEACRETSLGADFPSGNPEFAGGPPPYASAPPETRPEGQ